VSNLTQCVKDTLKIAVIAGARSGTAIGTLDWTWKGVFGLGGWRPCDLGRLLGLDTCLSGLWVLLVLILWAGSPNAWPDLLGVMVIHPVLGRIQMLYCVPDKFYSV